MKFSPPKVILLFFLAVIAFGAALLSLPFARGGAQPFSALTSAFMATSAVCVTGLAVVDIGTYYSLFGQLVILFLIQIGGLGYMMLSTMLGLFLGKISLKERTIIKEVLDVSSFAGLLSLLKKVTIIVFAVEGIGAVILTIAFLKQFSFLKALYFGIFHSVSAFCNAGLSLFRDNFESFSYNGVVLSTIGVLIVVGGLGFLVLHEMAHIVHHREGKLSVHARIVLAMTSVLLAGGTLLFWIFERAHIFAGKGLLYGLGNSLFQSVTARTAGFSSLPIGFLETATGVLLMPLMFIGASPGGTGGGIKTSTFALILLAVIAVLRSRDDVNVYGKHILSELISKAMAVFVLSIFIVSLSALVLIGTQTHATIDLLFETVSAFATVGLSRGITSSLNDIGQVVIIITMIIGRIGPIAFLMALLRQSPQSGLIKYPEGKVLIG